MRRSVLVLALGATLAFSSGAFSYFVYPGQSETVTQVTVQTTPVVDRCTQFWQLVADAQTREAVAMLRRYHPDADCYYDQVPTTGLSGLAPPTLPPPLTLP
jgi:hypothetical protein